MRTPPVASPAVATPSGAAANQPVARRKRRTKAEMEATCAAEAAAPNARRGRKPGGDVDPQAAETAPVGPKRKRRTKAEMAAVAATVAVTKRRRGNKAETVGEAEPAPVTVMNGSAAGAVPDSGAARSSDPALEASSGSAPDADPSIERVAD